MNFSNINAPYNIGDTTCLADSNIHFQGTEAMPVQTMCDIMQETSSMASDALVMIRKINSTLFGEKRENSEQIAVPGCFRDELLKTRYELSTICEELDRISNKFWAV